MTFREKLQMEYPEYVGEMWSGGCRQCPSTYEYEKKRNCDFWESDEKCEKCWDREMPSEDKPFTKEEVYRESGYNQGLNDAWGLARKLELDESDGGISCDDCLKIFGEGSIYDIFKHNTPQEALAKLKAYEEQGKIEVGDVVFCSLVAEDDNDTDKKDNYGVVTGIYRDHYEILMKNGDTTGFKKGTCKKTGKHIDIQQLLDSIGE